jgi:hypothetical protein
MRCRTCPEVATGDLELAPNVREFYCAACILAASEAFARSRQESGRPLVMKDYRKWQRERMAERCT